MDAEHRLVRAVWLALVAQVGGLLLALNPRQSAVLK